MKKVLLIILIMASICVEASSLEIIITNVKSIIKSSKVGYQDSFLVIAKTKSIKETLSGVGAELIKEGAVVEFLFSKKVCYDEFKTALSLSKPYRIGITNLKKDLIKFINKPEYSVFVKASIIKDQKRDAAGCKLSVL